MLSFSHLFCYCALPLHLDTYRGCSHGCAYCYATARRDRSKPKPIDIEKALSAAERALDGQGDARIVSALARRIAIRFGVLGDPFPAQEVDVGATARALRWAAEKDYPVTIATKGAEVAMGYAEQFASPLVHLQVSLSTLDEDEAARLEPEAPSPSSRLTLVEAVARAGGFVTVRLAPLIPWLRTARDPSETVATLASAGAKHLMVEHLKLPRNRGAELKAATGLDIGRLFAGSRTRGHRAELQPERRIATVLDFMDAAHDAGLSFGCGDNDLHLASDSVCCCGTDLALGDVVNPALAQRASQVLRKTGSVSWGDVMDDWAPSGSIDLNATSARKLAGSRRAPNLRRAIWVMEGIGQYGAKRLPGHRFTWDDTVRHATRLRASSRSAQPVSRP